MDTRGFVLRERKSEFVHKFTKTPAGIVCPHFWVLAHGNGCPFGCDYCYLQLTFRTLREPTVFSNREDLLRDVRAFLTLEEPSVLSAGELCDALAFDGATGLSKDLVPLFAAQERHKLLFLTKSTAVGNLLEMRERKNVIVAFSVNAPRLAERFEHRAAPVRERLREARACQEAGYEVRLRIDPIIPVEGWAEHYRELIDAIGELVRTDGLRITLGSIRYFRSLPGCAKARGRDPSVFAVATSADGPDGRLRVPLAKRVALYRWMREQLPAGVTTALCKESAEAWERLGWEAAGARCNCAL